MRRAYAGTHSRLIGGNPAIAQENPGPRRAAVERLSSVRCPPVGPFVATLIAALAAGLVAREALDLPLVAAMAIALVAGLAADYAVRRRTSG